MDLEDFFIVCNDIFPTSTTEKGNLALTEQFHP
jgi:hypothetical protein